MDIKTAIKMDEFIRCEVKREELVKLRNIIVETYFRLPQSHVENVQDTIASILHDYVSDDKSLMRDKTIHFLVATCSEDLRLEKCLGFLEGIEMAVKHEQGTRMFNEAFKLRTHIRETIKLFGGLENLAKRNTIDHRNITRFIDMCIPSTLKSLYDIEDLLAELASSKHVKVHFEQQQEGEDAEAIIDQNKRSRNDL